MGTENLPLGAGAGHPDWPQALFNVSGLFGHDPLLLRFVAIVEQKFEFRVPLETLHGAPGMRWNAGRPSRARFDLQTFQNCLQSLYARNIGVCPTFTNHLIDDNDLADPVGNQILEIVSQRPDLNGVIVTSDLLSGYIARKYPDLRQIASTTKVTFEQGAGRVEYYRELGQRFSRYVIHLDDGRNYGLLDQLDREKTEIIVNENCAEGCPNRAWHYDAYGRWQKAAGTPEQHVIGEELKHIISICPSPLHLDRPQQRTRSCNLTRGEMKKLYDMGFRHFKLQGRADDPYTIAYDLCRFTLDPDFAAPLMEKLLNMWLRQVLVKMNQ